jgi:hypothetical protein
VIPGGLEVVVVVAVEPEAEVDIPSQVGMDMFRRQSLLMFRQPGEISRMELRKTASMTVLNKLPNRPMSRTTSKMEFLPRLGVG